MGGQYNRNGNNPEQVRQPRVFDQGNRTEDLPELPIGDRYSRVSSYRDQLQNLPNRADILNNEDAMLTGFAMIMALSETPVYKYTVRGETFRCVKPSEVDPLYNQYRNDLAVQIMANSFATNPQYRQQLMQNSQGYIDSGAMVTNISRSFANSLNNPNAERNIQPGV